MDYSATISDLTGDVVLYRDLEPCDAALPRLAALRAALNMPPGQPPRKRDQAYARVALAVAHAARRHAGGPPLAALAVIGDTENDRLLATHLAALGELPTYGFIGEDRPVAAEHMVWHEQIATATRWHLIHAWATILESRGVDWARTALLIDLDKTLLGPRGRSDGAIDDARAEGALVIAHTIYPELDVPAFRRDYAELCRSEWHSYTLDNQDYVVATALFAAAGAIKLEHLQDAMTHGPTPTFAQQLSASASQIPAGLAPLHAELFARVAQSDPTPFKAFRRAELTATLERMADGRLTLCSDIYHLAQRLKAQGALCLAASDKPAESAIPSAEQQAIGMLPLHRMPAKIG
ncbi:hypothetical protein [Candidatus Viridilinea mediisalina]|uniref:Uncharacterized protein n=1 Tax=Candidatus Viridilinea mediisalina TaxID=2024553 RepID=A0A2A6RN09_9CHLR|nr:hypothetical protein [Candidatus Viridilinea mediisalina]PDW04306.1 hypothetical protein CJ255_04470 [Candidatus Viridilinea mediisalina]